jgi:RNA polymerase sigma-70 factor (ECF subfamily)
MQDDEDYDAFYRATAPGLTRQLTLVTGNVNDAQDAVQEAFARAWQRWSTISRYDAHEAWVRTVALRLAVSRWRKARNAIVAWQRHGPPDALPGAGEDTVALVAALRQLPEPQRIAIVLHHLLDLPVTEVARETGVPSGTVKARLARGRAALEPLLTEAGVRRPITQETNDHG